MFMGWECTCVVVFFNSDVEGTDCKFSGIYLNQGLDYTAYGIALILRALQ